MEENPLDRVIEFSEPDYTWHNGMLIPLNKDAVIKIKPIGYKPMNELGTVNIKKLVDDLVATIELGKEVSKDGITISDIFSVPKLVGLLINGYSKYPEASKEFKDLTAQEVLELVTYVGAGVLKVIFGEDFSQKVK